MGAWSFIQSLASFIANLLTILASGIAIWLFLLKLVKLRQRSGYC